MENNKRIANVIFNKSGGKGGITTKITLPAGFVRTLRADIENRTVQIELIGDKIQISPIKTYKYWSDLPFKGYESTPTNEESIFELKLKDGTKEFVRIEAYNII